VLRRPVRFGSAVVLGVVALTGCNSGSATPTPTLTPTTVITTPPPPALAHHRFLSVRYLAPRGWPVHKDRRSSTDGDVTYTAPGNRGRVYVEVNTCAACVDEGDVHRAQRNGVPLPSNVISQYQPATRHRLSPAAIAFTAAVPPRYHSAGLLVVTKADGLITGYVVIEATAPHASTVRDIVASLRGHTLLPR
jgi:hypothetical protein